jgi:hypothetical protein
MTLSAPIQFDQHDQHDQHAGRDQAPDVTPATATLPTRGAAQAQPQPETAAPHVTTTSEQQAINTSWGGIVLATLALWGGLGLWTIIAVGGGYVRWVLSAVVLGIIMVICLVALKRVFADK